MATKNVILKDSSSNELRPETSLTQVKDASGNDLFVQNSGVISTTSGNSFDGASINDASIGAAKLGNGILEGIKDSQGNPRFIDDSLAVSSSVTDAGVTIDYARWSLSGSHLMFVLQLSNQTVNDITLTSWSILASPNNLPQFIVNKIYPIEADDNNVALVRVNGINAGLGVSTNTFLSYLTKETNTIYLRCWNSADQSSTLLAGYHYRIQFDLIIDTD